MALHNLKIVVVDGVKSGSYKSKNAGTSSNSENQDYKNTALYKALNLKETITDKVTGGSKTNPAGVMVFNMATQLAKQAISQTANYYISDIGRANGDSNYQQLVNREIEVISDAGSVISSALSGAATGSMFGFGGAVAGAVAGLTSSAISLGFRQAERERTYQHTMFENNNSQAYNLARANYSAWTGRAR